MSVDESKLVERRSPEELKFLKKHIAELRNDPEVKAAVEKHETAAPIFTVEAFYKGVVIQGYACRLTRGTLSLLRAVESRMIGYRPGEGRLTDYDIALALFLLCDDRRNEAVSLISYPDDLQKRVRKFSRSLNINVAAVELYSFLDAQSDALAGRGTGSGLAPPDDGWSDDVDLFAHEYGWSFDFVLWELPIVTGDRLKDSIEARRKGERRVGRRAESGIALLKTLETRGQELLKGAGHG